MASIDDLTVKVEELAGDIARVVQALEGVELPSETQAKVDALAARLDQLNDILDTAVPEGGTPEPTP